MAKKKNISEKDLSSYVKGVDKKKLLPSGIGQIDTPKSAPPIKLTGDIEAELPIYDDLKLYNKTFGDDFFVINDLTLIGIPVISYSFDSQHDAFVAETLRSKAPIVTSKGIQNWTLSFSLVFKQGREQSEILHRLVAELSKNPIVYIHNRRVREALNIPDDDSINTIFILENANLRNSMDSVGPIVLDLKMHLFNYKPFSNHFWYNTYMPGFTRAGKDKVEKKAKRLTDTTGYESSSYALSYEAENIENDIRLQAISLSEKGSNAPVPFPSASDAFVYYANHLQSTIPPISERTSDHIGLVLRYYQHYTPPVKAANTAGGSASKSFNDPFKAQAVPPVYNANDAPYKKTTKKAITPINTGSLGIAVGESQADLDDLNRKFAELNLAASKKITFAFSKHKKTITVDRIVDETGKLDEAVYKELAPYFANPVTKAGIKKFKKKKMAKKGWKTWPDTETLPETPPDNYFSRATFKRFAYIAARWPGKTITIVSAIRNYGTKNTSQHVKGLAVDFKVRGVSNVDLFMWVATNFKRGWTGWYPEADNFVHMDSRSQRMKVKADCGETNKSFATCTKEFDKMVIEKVRGMIARKERFDPLPDAPPKEKVKEPEVLVDKRKELEDAKAESDEHAEEAEADKEEINETHDKKGSKGKTKKADSSGDEAEKKDKSIRKEDVRRAWKSEMLTQHNLFYYDQDPTVRNMFYTEVRQNVDSDITLPRGGIVCTSVSISFGHRITPKKILSQDSYSWQFLGAGNRQGTMLFQFSGRDGRKAADKIKQMVHGSRENARKYGSFIEKVGSLQLHSSDNNGGRTNSVFSLLNVQDIVVTEIREQSLKGYPDSYTMELEFIVQEFDGAKLERRFGTDINRKKKIIEILMSMLTALKVKDGKVEKGSLFDKINNEEFNFIAKDKQYIKVKDKYVASRIKAAKSEAQFFLEYPDEKLHDHGYARPYKLNDASMPIWLANVLIRTAKLCRTIDQKIPPTNWRKDDFEKWSSVYGEWDKKGLIKGRVQNIPYREFNTWAFPPNSDNEITARRMSKDRIKGNELQRMFDGDFDYDGSNSVASGVSLGTGGYSANKRHKHAYKEFTDGLELIYQETIKYVTDEQTFEHYFGDIGKEILAAVTQDLGGCYEDMELPNIPLDSNAAMALPPEFYVYDDSKEDPALATISDPASMKAMLSQHMDNELASVAHFFKDSALGGSYLSTHLPNIINDRKRHMQMFGGEGGELDFMDYPKMHEEGCTTWEPVYYRKTDTSYDTTGKLSEWMKELSGDEDNEEIVREKFMDQLIKLNPYLGAETKGSDNWDTSSYGNGYLVEKIYDDNWREMSFGPSPENVLTDGVIDGQIPSASTKKNAQKAKEDGSSDKPSKSEYLAKQEEIADKADKSNTVFHDKARNATFLKDGTILLGESLSLETEFGAKLKAATGDKDHLKMSLNPFASDSSKPKQSFENRLSAALGPNSKIKLYSEKSAEEQKQDKRDEELKSRLNVKEKQKSLFGSVATSYNNFIDAAKAKIAEAKDIVEQNVHPVKNKFNESASDNMAKLASGIAFQSKGKELSLRRAFPTFKIYFIEDDAHQTELVNGEVLRAFDDFYSYSAIQEIRISRSRKIAADFAIIRMVNIGGKLLRGRFGQKDKWKREYDEKYGKNAEYATGIFADTDKENPFEKMILSDGVKVQIRLGYSDQPDNLESVFLGSVVEIAPSSGGKILEIKIQGFGAELENVELGSLSDGPLFYSAQGALSCSIIQDSIVNFGRRSKFQKFNPGEIRSKFTGGEGRGVLSSMGPAQLLRDWGEEEMYKHLYKFPFRNHPQDDNIYAPPPRTYAGKWESFYNNACLFRPIKQTAYEVFKEHELRHPGYISLAVPYGHSPRMTMFFGSKGQHYWAEPPSPMEVHLATGASDLMIELRGLNMRERIDNKFIAKVNKLRKKHPQLGNAIIQSMTSKASPANVGREVGRLFGRYKPFRNYHYFDSYHHILKNNIRSSADGAYNEVEILYFEEENKIEDDNGEDLYNNIKQLSVGNHGRYTCKLDENIPQQHIKSYVQEFPSCITEFMAKRYAQGLFARLLRDGYKGSLTIMGEPSIKPYDICYLNDASINMTGPIEVEAVEHIFNRDHGYISIITPDLCIDVQELYSISTLDMIGNSLSYMWNGGKNNGDITAAMTALACPAPVLALAGGIKYGMWMQDGSPVIATPLTLGGKPFISISLGQDRVSMFTQFRGDWNQWWDDLDDAWAKYDINETVETFWHDVNEGVYGLGRDD